MELAYVKCLVLLFLIGSALIYADAQCTGSSPNIEAAKMYPCKQASQDPNAWVPPACCDKVRALVGNPACLCAAMLSPAAKALGSKPSVAVTVPKRCDIRERRVGYNCGGFTTP